MLTFMGLYIAEVVTPGLTGMRTSFPHVPVKPVVERSRYAAEKNLKIVYASKFAQFRALLTF